MAQTRDDRSSQSWIINLIEKFNYIKSSGVCYGLAHMATQALLLDDFQTFTDRMALINCIEGAVNSCTKKTYKINTYYI